MYKKIILIPPSYAYGDCLSVISLLYYLLNHYESVYFNIDEGHFLRYYSEYFSNDPLYNVRIFINTTKRSLGYINEGEVGEYHVCDTRLEPNRYISNPKITHYFDYRNPLYNHFDIDESLITKPNSVFPNESLDINHVISYKLLGLNNKVRMDYFHYSRNIEKEKLLKKQLFEKFNIPEDSKYNIINDPITAWRYTSNNKIKNFIKNEYPIINISDQSPCVGLLTHLLEGAEEIHFIENNNVNFFYHAQYKNIFNYNKNIYFHVWLRNRDWKWAKNVNFDSAWKMMADPILENWKFIIEESDLKKYF
jgi:hypothetical protein